MITKATSSCAATTAYKCWNQIIYVTFFLNQILKFPIKTDPDHNWVSLLGSRTLVPFGQASESILLSFGQETDIFRTQIRTRVRVSLL